MCVCVCVCGMCVCVRCGRGGGVLSLLTLLRVWQGSREGDVGGASGGGGGEGTGGKGSRAFIKQKMGSARKLHCFARTYIVRQPRSQEFFPSPEKNRKNFETRLIRLYGK